MQGKMLISDEVFLEIAKTAMLNVNEVSLQERKSTLGGITQIFAERFTPQISVKKYDDEEEEEKNSVALDLKLTLLYGVSIPETVKRVRETITKEIEEMTGYKVEYIDVYVDKLIKAEKLQSEEVKE